METIQASALMVKCPQALFTSHWAKREKKLMKAMENLVSLYGDVRGIAGGAVQEIKALEIQEYVFPEV